MSAGSFFGVSGGSDLSMLSAGANSEQEQRSAGEQTNILYEFSRGNIGILVDGKNIITDQLDDAQKTFEKNKSRSFKLGSVEFSFAEGEFAKIANMFVSGSYVTTVYKAVCNITGSSTAAIIIMIVISLVLRLMIVFFVLNVFEVIMARLFLESGTYEKLPLKSWLFLIRSKRWFRTAFVLIVRSLYQALWTLTIVGGVIKHFSYYLVPFCCSADGLPERKSLTRVDYRPIEFLQARSIIHKRQIARSDRPVIFLPALHPKSCKPGITIGSTQKPKMNRRNQLCQ